MVVALLQGPLSVSEDVTKQGMFVIGCLAKTSDDNSRLLGAAGACKGE